MSPAVLASMVSVRARWWAGSKLVTFEVRSEAAAYRLAREMARRACPVTGWVAVVIDHRARLFRGEGRDTRTLH